MAQCGVAGLDLSRGTLAKIEARVRGISDIELFVIAMVLGVEMEALFPKDFSLRIKHGQIADG